jgi:hypothetical protein
VSREHSEPALEMMERNLDADLSSVTDCPLE